MFQVRKAAVAWIVLKQIMRAASVSISDLRKEYTPGSILASLHHYPSLSACLLLKLRSGTVSATYLLSDTVILSRRGCCKGIGLDVMYGDRRPEDQGVNLWSNATRRVLRRMCAVLSTRILSPGVHVVSSGRKVRVQASLCIFISATALNRQCYHRS